MRKAKLSPGVIEKLAEISAGYLPENVFDKFIELISSEIKNKFFTHSSESNLLRIILSMYDKVSFIGDCVKYPHYVEILISIAVNSNYLTDILVRNPEYFYWIVNPSNLDRNLDEDELKDNLRQNINSYKSLNAKLNFLRSQKRKEILRIGTKDILGTNDLKTITEELSILARSITSILFSICYNEVLNKYNLQLNENLYCLIALGKLGGDELNYSSDIDLVIFYDDSISIKNKKSFREILIEVIYLFIESATAVTSLGYIFRIDFRLRPDGRTSLLTRSLQEYLNYYESRGEDWERQMLIKAGFVSGSKMLFKNFIGYLQPFIYPSSFSISPMEQIKKLKNNIEKSLKDDENIKLIPGGIRDIEFSVQALQLLNGGKLKKIRSNNTLDAIDYLKVTELLNEEEADVFYNSYIFYRKIEHYLQLMNDTQTHSIPSEGEILEKLSSYLGFKSSKQFNEAVAQNRNNVKAIYDSIIGKESELSLRENKISNIKFENPNRADKDFIYLSEGKGLLGQKEFDKSTIESFVKIEPSLIKYLDNCLQPDLVLQNFVRVIRNITFPSIWYNEFLDEKFFKSFLQLCEFSQKSIDLFAEDTDLHEYFLTRKVFQKYSNSDFINFNLKKLFFTLSVQITVELISIKKFSTTLSNYFLERIKLISKQFFSEIETSQIFIAGMGSFSIGEMTFASDIDLIFGTKSFEADNEVEKKFQGLLLKFKEEFKPFEVDCRLRPEGKSSQLVWELNSYKNYLQNRARIWELQAFSKMNFIFGDRKSYNNLIKSLVQRIKLENPESIKKEMKAMRAKMFPSTSYLSKNFYIKKSSGGISDIEFIIQYLLLSNPDNYRKNIGKNKIKKLKNLQDKLTDNIDYEKLKDNFLFLKNLEILNQNIFNISSAMIAKDENKYKIYAKNLGISSANEFKKKLGSVIKENHTFYKNIFND